MHVITYDYYSTTFYGGDRQMKITMISMYETVERTLDEFFELNETVEFWYKVIYRLMWRKGVTSFTMNNVKLTFYRERDVYFVGYETEDN